MRSLIVLLIMLVGASSFANIRDHSCLDGKDARSIVNSFRGLRLGEAYRNNIICENDIDSRTFKVLKVLKRISEISHLGIVGSPLDDMEVSPIQEKNWWSYLKSRVRDIELPQEGIINFSCADSVTALARRPTRTITMCPHFFSGFSVNDLVATVMHEVRHFDDDGHPHAVCNGGVFEGRRACDETVHDHGSYAVGLQTLVRLAKNPENLPLEKYELEARALYQAHSKFNQDPEVKLTENLVVSNQEGEIYKKTEQGLVPLGSYDPHISLSFVKSNAYNSFTLVLEDSNEHAKRVLPDFRTEAEHSLILQTLYNDELVRDSVLDLDYSGTPALLTETQIISNCRSREISHHNLTNTVPERMIHYFDNEEKIVKSVVMTDGSMVDLLCSDTTLEVVESSYSLSDSLMNNRIKDTAIINDSVYALLEDGSIVKLMLLDNELTILEAIENNTEWTNLTRLERPTIFE